MPPRHEAFTKPTVFRLNAPKAHAVELVIRSAKEGSPSTRPLHKGIDGTWQVTVELPRGRYLYRFLVDHVPTLDPASRGTVHDDHHGPCSMREVGH
jgi:1,4-alpha-glucan branching enzyme